MIRQKRADHRSGGTLYDYEPAGFGSVPGGGLHAVRFDGASADVQYSGRNWPDSGGEYL